MNAKFIPKMGTIRVFFPKIRAFFSIFKKGQGRPLSVNEYAPISLNIPKYPWILVQCSYQARLWICLVILNVQQALEDAFVSKCIRVLNMAQFYIQGLRRVLNMTEYGSICLNNAWICLKMPAWLNCCDYARVLNIPHHLRYLTRL